MRRNQIELNRSVPLLRIRANGYATRLARGPGRELVAETIRGRMTGTRRAGLAHIDHPGTIGCPQCLVAAPRTFRVFAVKTPT